LVRILMRHGVSIGEFTDAVRASFIDIARNELLVPGRPDTDARLALLTGLTKREVHRIRTSSLGEDEGIGLDRISRVLQGWTQDAEFLGPYGLPLEIPFAGDRLSFTELVHRYAGDADPALLLEELTRARAALQTVGNYVRLLNRSYLPSPLDPSGLERFGSVVGYFIDTLDFNLKKKRQGEGRYERYAMTMEGVSTRDFQAFDSLVREKGQELLEILDDWLGQHEIKGGHKLSPTESIRTGVGIFHFVEKSPPVGDEFYGPRSEESSA
jgi:hypothetical protein